MKYVAAAIIAAVLIAADFAFNGGQVTIGTIYMLSDRGLIGGPK